MRRYRKPHRFKIKKSVVKNRFLLLGFFIFILFIAISYFLFFSNFFLIEEIIVSGNRKVLKEEIIKVAENEFLKKKLFFPVKNILLVNLGNIKENILDAFPQIVDVKIKRKLPETLSFNILERKGAAQFCRAFELFTKEESQTVYQKCFLLDEEGIVFEEIIKDNIFLPKIVLSKSQEKNELELGQEIIEKQLLSGILDIFSQLKELNIETKEFLIVSEERINVKTLDNWEIYFNPKEDLTWQLTKLKAVLKNIPLEKRNDLEYIELRFGNFAPPKYRQIEE